MLEGTPVRWVFRTRHHCIPRDVRRNQDCRYANPKPVKFEFQPRNTCGCRPSGKSVRNACRWYNVIIEPAMLIIDNQQRRSFPEIRDSTDMVIDTGNEFFAR